MDGLNFIEYKAINTEQIIKGSVIEIRETQQLQDKRMGSSSERCGTCLQFSKGNTNNLPCLGHYGHIPLPFSVFSGLLTKKAVYILELVCLNCLKIAIKGKDKMSLLKQIKQIKNNVKNEKAASVKCPHCNNILEHFVIENLSTKTIQTDIPLYIKCTKFQAYNIKRKLDGINIQEGGVEQVIISNSIVNRILQNLIHQPEAVRIAKNKRLFECFMLDALPVPPNSMRVLDQQTTNHTMNQVYSAVITAIQYLKDIKFVDDLYLPQLDDIQLKNLRRIIVGCRVAMYKDTSKNAPQQIKQLLHDILKIPQLEPSSALSQCLTKKGWFRGSVSSVRVGMSARSVVVGDPWLDSDQVVIPKFFACNLFLPRTVNNTNIETLKALINNYPNYPCAVRRISIKDGTTYTIKEELKQIQTSQCQVGDVVMVQIVEGDIVMMNRYPTLREESFSAMRVSVEDTKAIKISLSNCEKFNADFDGDEQDIFVMASLADCIEAVNLYSIYRQFITYETGLNIIGGNGEKQNIYPGLFHLQNETFKKEQFPNVVFSDKVSEDDSEGGSDDNEAGGSTSDSITGIQLVQQLFDNVIYKTQKGRQLLSELNYDDGNIIIKDGKFKKIGVQLASAHSLFLSHIQFHHGQARAVNILNNITHLAYQANHIAASTIMNNIFLNEEQNQYLKNIDLDRVNVMQQIMDDYYTGKIKAPAGFDKYMYFEKLFQDRRSDNEGLQFDKILEYIKIDEPNNKKHFLNTFYAGTGGKLLTALGHLGQQFDQGKRILADTYYGRTLACYFKHQKTPQSEGYVMGKFINGLLQKEMFMNAVAERRNTYIKGNTTAISGYLGRRINQGAGNMFIGANGIVYSDGQQIISLQYGCAGYDPRHYILIPFTAHSITIEEFKDTYGKHPRYEEMLQIRNDLLNYEKILKNSNPDYPGIEHIAVPFKFDKTDVSEQQLDQLFSCRLCSKMSKEFKMIIISQVYIFYIYCLFFLDINPNSKHDVVSKYIKSLSQIGDPVGMKAGMACSQPYTQDNLSAIHSKGVVMTIIQEKKTDGVTRFQELVIGNKGPSVVQFQLLGDLKYDQQANIDFVSNFQTIQFSSLNPQITINQMIDRYGGQKKNMIKMIKDKDRFEKANLSDFIMKIRFEIKQLAYYNVNIESLVEQLYSNNVQIKQIIPFVEEAVSGEDGSNEGGFVYFMVYTVSTITKQQIGMLKTFLLNNQIIGKKMFYNLYYDPPNQLSEGQEYKLIANITNDQNTTIRNVLLQIYQIPGIDPKTIYCSDPKSYEPVCGIIKTRLSLYTQLYNNLATSKSTKLVQCVHVKTISDQTTQSGQLTYYTRSSYKKDGIRNTCQNMLFESGDQFLQEDVSGPQQKQTLTTVLNSCIYGSVAEMGSTVSQVYFNKVLQVQDKVSLQQMMDDEEDDTRPKPLSMKQAKPLSMKPKGH